MRTGLRTEVPAFKGHVEEDELAKETEGMVREGGRKPVCFLRKLREKRFQCPVMLLRGQVR